VRKRVRCRVKRRLNERVRRRRRRKKKKRRRRGATAEARLNTCRSEVVQQE